MSQAARQALVDSPNTIFQNPESQRADLLDATKTSTELIALLTDLCITHGIAFEFTAIHSDHHDDSGLNPTPPHYGTHEGGDEGGYAADGWFLNTPKAGDYMEPSDPRFQKGLEILGAAPYHMQTGLAGSAYTHADVVAAGSGVFQDDGGDHIHAGVHG